MRRLVDLARAEQPKLLAIGREFLTSYFVFRVSYFIQAQM
jgi:hypothetical protein